MLNKLNFNEIVRRSSIKIQKSEGEAKDSLSRTEACS